MDAIKKTLKKYFISDDGSLSLTALSSAGVTVAALVITANKLWPISMEDLSVLGGILSGGGVLVGFRKALKK